MGGIVGSSRIGMLISSTSKRSIVAVDAAVGDIGVEVGSFRVLNMSCLFQRFTDGRDDDVDDDDDSNSDT